MWLEWIINKSLLLLVDFVGYMYMALNSMRSV